MSRIFESRYLVILTFISGERKRKNKKEKVCQKIQFSRFKNSKWNEMLEGSI